jgi:hypothetical protein
MSRTIIYDDIPSKNTPWENYAGSSVEKFIKQQFNSKVGWMCRKPATESDMAYLYGFTDYDTYVDWMQDVSTALPLFSIALPYDEDFEMSVTFSTSTPIIKINSEGETVNATFLYKSMVKNKRTQQTTVTDHSGTMFVYRNNQYVGYKKIDSSSNNQNVNITEFVDVNEDNIINNFSFILVDDYFGIRSTVAITVKFAVDGFIYDVTDHTQAQDSDNVSLNFQVGGEATDKDLIVLMDDTTQYSVYVGNGDCIDPPKNINNMDTIAAGGAAYYKYYLWGRTPGSHKVTHDYLGMCFIGSIVRTNRQPIFNRLDVTFIKANKDLHLCDLMHCYQSKQDIGVQLTLLPESSRFSPSYDTYVNNCIQERLSQSGKQDLSDYDLFSLVSNHIYPGTLQNKGYKIDSALNEYKWIEDYTNWATDWEDSSYVYDTIKLSDCEPFTEYAVNYRLNIEPPIPSVYIGFNSGYFDNDTFVSGYGSKGITLVATMPING